VELPGALGSFSRVPDHEGHPRCADEDERRQARNGEPEYEMRLLGRGHP
jgi:hypothetical protein